MGIACFVESGKVPQPRSTSFFAVCGFTQAGEPSSALSTRTRLSIHFTPCAYIPYSNCRKGGLAKNEGPDNISGPVILKSQMPYAFDIGSYGISITSVLETSVVATSLKFAICMYLSGWCAPTRTLKLAS